MKAKTLTLADITFKLECLPEDTPVRGNALASGDDAEDKRAEDDIISQLDNGNEWAWCCVKLTGRYKGLKAHDTLGCCSYASREDFEQNSGYYDDMRDTVRDELQAQLDEIVADQGE